MVDQGIWKLGFSRVGIYSFSRSDPGSKTTWGDLDSKRQCKQQVCSWGRPQGRGIHTPWGWKAETRWSGPRHHHHASSLYGLKKKIS